MANVQITQLPIADTLTGSELVPIVQNGVTVRTTTGNITSGPSLTQTFITVNNEATLANSRYLSVGSGITLTDNGAQSNYVISLTGAISNLNALGTGIVATTGASTLANRTITAGTVGLSLTNGDGVSGDPTVSLTGAPFYAEMAERFATFMERHPGREALEARLRPGVSPLSAVMLVSRFLLHYFAVELVFGVPNHFGKDNESVLREIAEILRHGMLRTEPPAVRTGAAGRPAGTRETGRAVRGS